MRSTAEDLAARWGRTVARAPRRTAAVMVALTLALLPQLRHLEFDLSIDSYLPAKDPAIEAFDAFRLQFGGDSTALVAIEAEGGVYDLATLDRIRRLHEAIEERTPYLREVTSLWNARLVRGHDDELLVEDLGEHWPRTPSDLPAFERRVRSQAAYEGMLVSADGRFAMILAEPVLAHRGDDETRPAYLGPDEEGEFVRALTSIADELGAPGFEIHLSGLPVSNHALMRDLGNEISLFMLLAIGIIGALLALLFRRASAVILPIVTVQLAVTITMALMPVLGYPFSGNTQILPSFLLTVGIAASVHLLSMFYRRYDEGAERAEAAAHAIARSGVAVVLTSLTTAAGLISFTAADLVPVVSLGIFGAIGVLLALVYSLTLLPALLVLLPLRRRPLPVSGAGAGAGARSGLEARIVAIGTASAAHPGRVLVGALVLTSLALAGYPRLRLSHDPIRWYPPGHPTRADAELIDRRMAGTQTLDLIVDTGVADGLKEPALMQLLAETETFVRSYSYEGIRARKLVSVLDVVRETHAALTADDPDATPLPESRPLLAQELLLFEQGGSDDLEQLVDHEYRTARATVVIPWENVIHYRGYIDGIRSGVAERAAALGLGPGQATLPDLELRVTGVMAVFARTLHVLLDSMFRSYGLAFLSVGGLMVLMMGGLRGGAVAMVPNVLPVVWTLGLMGWIGIPVNMLTVLVGCIVLGIAVDDTIHLVHHVRREAEAHPDPRDAIRVALGEVGRALVVTSVVLGMGFLVFVSGQFISTQWYGTLLAFAVATALLADLVVAPALLATFWRGAGVGGGRVGGGSAADGPPAGAGSGRDQQAAEEVAARLRQRSASGPGLRRRPAARR